MNECEKKKAEFVEQLEKAKVELRKAYNMVFDEGDYTRAKYIENSINQLDALLHIERITKPRVYQHDVEMGL